MTNASNRKLKLLFIAVDKFPPFRVDMAVLFGQELAGRGHSIDWLLQSEAPCKESYQTEWSGCRVWVGATDNGMGRWNRVKKHIFSIWNDMRMFGLARRNHYDFIQVKDKILPALAAIVAAKLSGAKFIYWLSYPFPEESLLQARDGTARYPFFYLLRGALFQFLLYRAIMPCATHVFVQSEQMKRDVAEMGIPADKMTAVPMGVTLEKIPFGTDAETVINSAGKKVLYLGTLSRVRKMDFIVRVFAQVIKKLPSVKLYLVGGGDDPVDEEILRKEADRLGISGAVVFTGFLPMSEAWQYVKQADVCVSPFYPTPALNSTSPTKLIEYMAMGKPVVANDHPEQRLVIAESGGGYCVPYEEGAFAEAIITLLNDPEEAHKKGLKGRRYVEECRTYQTIAGLVEDKYLELFRS